MKKFETYFRLLIYGLMAAAIISYLSGCASQPAKQPQPAPQEKSHDASCRSPEAFETAARALADARGLTLTKVELTGADAAKAAQLFNASAPPTDFKADTVHIYRAGRTRDLLVLIWQGCITHYDWPTADWVTELLQQLYGQAV